MTLLISILLAALLAACTNSDDALFDASESSSISISAKLSIEKDSVSRQGKADTICPTDTLTFIADVEPSRSIRMQKYYWTLDGEKWAYEFSFRSNIIKPGHHKVALVLVDYFGDTLSDTLNVWVGNLPVLDEKTIIPLPGTQQIPPESGVSFAWHAYDPDSIYSMHYRFVLMDKNLKTVLDTLVDESNLVYNKPLDPLEQYTWYVAAFNDIGLTAATTISGSFFTKGAKDESAIVGSIQTSAIANRISSDSITVTLTFLDSSGAVVSTDTLGGYTDKALRYTKKPLAAGVYKLVASLPSLTDYAPDTLSVQLLPSEVYNAETLHLTDIVPPAIWSVPTADTLDFVDTLRFFVKDGGTELTLNNVQLNFDGKRITDGISFNNDTLTFVLRDFPESVTYRLLSLSATDLSGNTNKRSFYVKPTLSWFECNSDVTMYDEQILEVFIRDTNPYGFEPDSFFFDIFKNDQAAAYKANGKSHSIKVTYNAFTSTVNHVRTGIRYTNGVTKWKEWNVNRIFKARSEIE